MTPRIQGTVEILAALLVLFTAMLDPRVSVVLSVAFLIGLGVYQFAASRK